eukprot:gb/GECG01008315.1/.p1 GENE.gb/GECG01008315.1/~~gb/GECG01008315.1/.p1  ORF type:complete len:411 (+),score=55.42 gb/GECG01008315.1/:1-1233(+)
MRLLLIGTGATAAGYYRALQHFLFRYGRQRTQGSASGVHEISMGVLSREVASDEVPSMDLEIWDKARGYGGRMSTSRSKELEGAQADLGAQYFTLYEQTHEELYDALEQAQVLQRFQGSFEGQLETQKERKNYIAPNGSSSVIKCLFEGSSPCFGRTITRIDCLDNAPAKWHVSTQEGICEYFDGIICTIPTPQVLKLEGTLRSLLSTSGLAAALEEGAYTSRYALGLYFDASQTNAIESTIPECGKFVPQEEDDVIRFVSFDSKKRGSSSSESPSLVVHTSVPYGISRLEESKDSVQEEILDHLRKLFPSIPTPVEAKTQRWRYSQVSQPVPGDHGGAIMLTRDTSPAASVESSSIFTFPSPTAAQEPKSTNPFIVFCGDSFMPSSNFDSCLASAHRAFELTLTQQGLT